MDTTKFFTAGVGGNPQWQAAVKRVHAMDDIDGVTQADYNLDVGLRTVLSAMECSVSENVTEGRIETFWDAFVMLQQIEAKHRLPNPTGQVFATPNL